MGTVNAKKSAIVTKIPSLPHGIYDGASLYAVDARGARDTVFVKVGEKVYTTRLRMDLADSWGMNDTIRRAWCRMSGVRFADLKAAIKKERDEEAKRYASRQMASFKSRAARMGYELRKIR